MKSLEHTYKAMYFTVKNVDNKQLSIYNIRATARSVVLLTDLGATEKALDRYFIDNYKMPLLQICLKIISKAKYYLNYQHEVVILINDKQLEKFAEIITYGTGKVLGSPILRNAFGQN